MILKRELKLLNASDDYYTSYFIISHKEACLVLKLAPLSSISTLKYTKLECNRIKKSIKTAYVFFYFTPPSYKNNDLS